jgi:small subunit ribosomal protein S18
MKSAPRGERGDRGERGEASPRQMKSRGCPFCSDPNAKIDYKDPLGLSYFVSERGKIVPRRVSGTCAKHQREVAEAINRARQIAILPFTANP